MRKNRTGHEEHSDHDTDQILAKGRGRGHRIWAGDSLDHNADLAVLAKPTWNCGANTRRVLY